MMSVGDDQLLVLHRALDAAHKRRIEDGPETVNHAVFVSEFQRRIFPRRVFEQVVDDARGIVIKKKKLSCLNARLTQQFDTVGLGSGQRALMAENNLRVVILNASQRDKAYANSARLCSGDQELLRVNVNARCSV